MNREAGTHEGSVLIEPRSGEQLPTARLEPYLRARLPEVPAPLTVLQFPGGRANLTYLLRFGPVEYVLRRPPMGPIAPRSHDMAREFRVLSRLYRSFRLAPRSYLFCDDESIIGAPFQVMERRRGIVIYKPVPVEFSRPDALKRRIGEMVVDVLADLHGVDRVAAGLADLGHPEGFVDRQLDSWAKGWAAAAHEDNPQMHWLLAWLRAGRVHSKRVALIHNDYKLDNVLVDAADPALPVAILDWDMCTSGDPLLDLGYLLNQWAEPNDDPAWIEEAAMPSAEPGFPTRAQVVARYAARTGLDVSNVDWYHAFAAMKFAVIIQQIYIRFHRGQTHDPRFAHFDRRARTFVDKGVAVARRAG